MGRHRGHICKVVHIMVRNGGHICKLRNGHISDRAKSVVPRVVTTAPRKFRAEGHEKVVQCPGHNDGVVDSDDTRHHNHAIPDTCVRKPQT